MATKLTDLTACVRRERGLLREHLPITARMVFEKPTGDSLDKAWRNAQTSILQFGVKAPTSIGENFFPTDMEIVREEKGWLCFRCIVAVEMFVQGGLTPDEVRDYDLIDQLNAEIGR